MKIRCPHCRHAIELLREDPIEELTCPSCHSRVDVSVALSMELGKTATITYAEDEVMPQPGDEIGHFRIEKELGKGGFGSVYSAFDTQLERRVAIKVPRMLQMKKWQAEVFVREARAAAQLRDPNIVGVHEVGRDKDRVYIVSDLIDGVTLRDWMEQSRPDARTAARMISKIAKAIHRAHQSGVIHRDIKPRNVLVDFHGEPHITDFGLAKRESPDEMTITVEGQVIGTPAYMSPEQITGRSQEADARTDVYALGVVLYEMLTGTRPFRGESDLLVNEITSGNPTPPRRIDAKIPRDLEAICLRAMSREPAGRFLSAADLADDLDRFLSGSGVRTRPPNWGKRVALWARQHKTAVALLALLLFGLAGWLGLWLKPSAQPPPVEWATLRVRVLYEPRDAELAIFALVDRDDSRLALNVPVEQATRAKNGAGELELAPGMYQIELSHPRFGQQTFFRRVPESLDEYRTFESIRGESFIWAYNNYEKLGTDEIKWQVLSMKPHRRIDAETLALGPTKLKRLRGGQFTSGLDESLNNLDSQFPQRTIEIQDFFVGETEVTVGEFASVMGFLPQELQNSNLPPEAPVSHIGWSAAVEYCERVGGRLPSFDEYVFACNRGLTRFPWGDNLTDDPVWVEPALKQPLFDVTPGSPALYNLYSSLLEWTSDRYVMPIRRDLETGNVKPMPPEIVLMFNNSRVLVGGDLASLGKKYSGMVGVRSLLSTRMDERRSEQGFRVYLDDPQSPPRRLSSN